MLEERESTNVVYQGWLIKSPPMKRLWRAKWRKRYFCLRDSGELPGQYVLEYFADRTCKKLKGQIDLDQLDQCDSGLTLKDSKHRYEFMFDLRTAKRVYYLAAETEEEMNRWVDYICLVCRLKMFTQQDGEAAEADSYAMRFVSSARHSAETSNAIQALDHSSPSDIGSPPVSPVSSSGPYVSLSECFTGLRSLPMNRDQENPISETSYDIPRSHPQYPVSDSDSLDSIQSPLSKSGATWDSFSREGSMTKVGLNNNAPTPPRPPKTHTKLGKTESFDCYVNISEFNISNEQGRPVDVSSPGPDFYDLPRTHQPELTLRKQSRRHFYTNANVTESDNRFTYDFVDPSATLEEGPVPPPSINRSLKPKTPVLSKSPLPSSAIAPSPTASHGPLSPFVQPPPLVNRRLKPTRTDLSPEDGSSKSSRQRAAPSPTPPLDISDEFRHLPRPNRVRHHSDGGRAVVVRRSSSTTSLNQTGSDRSYDPEIEYLDLDLRKESYSVVPSTPGRPSGARTSTVYKKVDFLKTEALKRIEEDRRREETGKKT